MAKVSEMQILENCMLQLETKPKNRILENSVQTQDDEEKSMKTLSPARITAPKPTEPRQR